MKAIPFSARRNWKEHIQDNAYQSEVLSDASQKYWVEALRQPFAIQFTQAEESQVAQATETLGEMCKEFLDWFFTDQEDGAVNNRLASLKIPSAYWPAIKASWERENPEDLTLYLRFDFAKTDGLAPKLMEINGETPLLGCETVYQWNWLEDMRKHPRSGIPEDASQFNEFWDKVAERWSYIIDSYRTQGRIISFLVDEKLQEDIEMALQLIQIIKDRVAPDQYCQLVYLRDKLDDDGTIMQRGMALDDQGFLVDHYNERMEFIWKIYDWTDLQNDIAAMELTELFANRLTSGDIKFFEPLWKQVLSNKGALVYLWQLFKDRPECAQYLLPTYFETSVATEVTALILRDHVRKPMLGLEGVGTEIKLADTQLEAKPTLGYGAEGFIVQEYAPLPEANGYFYMIGSWLVGGLEDGEAAGIIIRGDSSRITGRYCMIIPHIVSDTNIIF